MLNKKLFKYCIFSFILLSSVFNNQPFGQEKQKKSSLKQKEQYKVDKEILDEYIPFVLTECSPIEGEETETRVFVSSLQSGFNNYNTPAPGYSIEYSISTGRPLLFNAGAELFFSEKDTKFYGATFNAESNYPLVFKFVKGLGLVYLCGKGTITTSKSIIYQLGSNDNFNIWLNRLKSTNSLVREGASQALGWLTQNSLDVEKSITALIEASRDTSKYVRRNVAESLGRIGDPRALPCLDVLSDTNNEKENIVREVAKESIQQIIKKNKK